MNLFPKIQPYYSGTSQGSHHHHPGSSTERKESIFLIPLPQGDFSVSSFNFSVSIMSPQCIHRVNRTAKKSSQLKNILTICFQCPLKKKKNIKQTNETAVYLATKNTRKLFGSCGCTKEPLGSYSPPVTATSLKPDWLDACWPGVGESLSIEFVLADLEPKPEAGGDIVPELKPSPEKDMTCSSIHGTYFSGKKRQDKNKFIITGRSEFVRHLVGMQFIIFIITLRNCLGCFLSILTLY